MITKMKKLTFLVYHKEYDAFLEQLRELGVVHIVERQCGVMDDALQQLLQRYSSYKHLLHCMQTWVKEEPEKNIHEEVSADFLESTYEASLARIQELNQQMSALDKDIASMIVWGDFKWESIKRLDEAGWHIGFYTCQESEFQQEWSEHYNIIIVKQDKGQLFFITVTPFAPDWDLESLQLPSLSLSEL